MLTLDKITEIYCIADDFSKEFAHEFKKLNILPEDGRKRRKRQDKDFLILWELLEVFPISVYHTDNWSSYSKYIPSHRHRIGKDRTWKIERKNLNFRTHIKRLNRKTICFSKNEQIHDNVIGMYIETFYYKTGKYGNNKFI
jgi:insertion element IS1 protein InsB